MTPTQKCSLIAVAVGLAADLAFRSWAGPMPWWLHVIVFGLVTGLVFDRALTVASRGKEADR